MAEVLEPLNIFRYRLPSLSELEELHLLTISDTIGKVLGEESPPEGLPSHMLSSLLHDGRHANPLVLSLSGEHIDYKSQPVIYWTHLRIKDSFQVL